MNRLRLVVLLLAIFHISFGQSGYPYKVYSENQQFFVKSVPFSSELWSTLGKTYVYSINDTISPIIILDQYFPGDYLFLSDDGRSLLYLDNWIESSTTNESEVLTFYKQGKPTRSYRLPDFALADSMRIRSLLYNSYNGDNQKLKFPKINRTNNHIVKGDAVYLFVQSERVYQFSMNDGKLLPPESFRDYMRKNKLNPSGRKVVKISTQLPFQFDFPKLADGNEFWVALEKQLDVTFLEDDNEDYEQKYKHHVFIVDCLIDSSGNCEAVRIDTKDSVHKAEIVKFFKGARFDKAELPEGIEKWWFHSVGSFRNKSKAVAEEERKQEILQEEIEYKRRITQDSINRVYIPIDIKDCFVQLNKMLKSVDRKEFASKKEVEAVGMYHMGLGLWMRNHWGLWNGSRLSYYFNGLGIVHPDDMSSIIMASYHRHLNGKDIKFEELLKH